MSGRASVLEVIKNWIKIELNIILRDDNLSTFLCFMLTFKKGITKLWREKYLGQRKFSFWRNFVVNCFNREDLTCRPERSGKGKNYVRPAEQIVSTYILDYTITISQTIPSLQEIIFKLSSERILKFRYLHFQKDQMNQVKTHINFIYLKLH